MNGCIRFVAAGAKHRIMSGDEPPWITNNPRASYIRACCLSAPLWVKRKEFDALRTEALSLTTSTGVPHVLDHIVPVTHPYVCGLTVPWNMRVVPKAVNAFKSNKWAPDQLELDLEDT